MVSTCAHAPKFLMLTWRIWCSLPIALVYASSPRTRTSFDAVTLYASVAGVQFIVVGPPLCVSLPQADKIGVDGHALALI